MEIYVTSFDSNIEFDVDIGHQVLKFINKKTNGVNLGSIAQIKPKFNETNLLFLYISTGDTNSLTLSPMRQSKRHKEIRFIVMFPYKEVIKQLESRLIGYTDCYIESLRKIFNIISVSFDENKLVNLGIEIKKEIVDNHFYEINNDESVLKLPNRAKD